MEAFDDGSSLRLFHNGVSILALFSNVTLQIQRAILISYCYQYQKEIHTWHTVNQEESKGGLVYIIHGTKIKEKPSLKANKKYSLLLTYK